MLTGKDGKYIIKEFSVFENWQGSHVIATATFLPPYHEYEIPLQHQRKNQFATTYIHGLGWYIGEKPYDELTKTLLQLTYGYTHLYVKGEEKSRLLGALLPDAQVINIESLGCPKLSQLNTPSYVPCHGNVHCFEPYLICAARNAKLIGSWLDYNLY
jgi:hypothetical protein